MSVLKYILDQVASGKISSEDAELYISGISHIGLGCIATDINGNAIHPGDIIITNGNEELITYDRHRELFGFGDVYGYYIPDVCELKSQE